MFKSTHKKGANDKYKILYQNGITLTWFLFNVHHCKVMIVRIG